MPFSRSMPALLRGSELDRAMRSIGMALSAWNKKPCKISPPGSGNRQIKASPPNKP